MLSKLISGISQIGTWIIQPVFFVPLILLGLFYFGAVAPGSIILVSDDPNIVYQYAGEIPPADRGSGSDNCAPDPAFTKNNIVFSDVQEIKSNGNSYRFEISDVDGAVRVDKTQCVDCVSVCGYNQYNAKIYKNNALLDQIDFNHGIKAQQSCSDLPESVGISGGEKRIVRDYDDVVVTFQYDGENVNAVRTGCNGAYQYIINKFEIKSQLDQPNTEVSGDSLPVSTSPSNKVYVTTKSEGFFAKIINSILGFFRGLFG